VVDRLKGVSPSGTPIFCKKEVRERVKLSVAIIGILLVLEIGCCFEILNRVV